MHSCIAKNIDTSTRATPSTAVIAVSITVILLSKGERQWVFCRALIVTVFLFALLCGLCVMFTSNAGEGVSFGGKLINTVSSFFSRKAPSMPLTLWEVKKVFVNQKGAVILAVILYIAVSSAFRYRYVLPSYTRSEEKYYQRYTGEMTVELQTEMNADLDDLQAQFDALRDEYLTKLDANGGLHDDELMKMYNRLMDMAEDLEFLRFVPFEMSILGYLVLMFIVRMLGAFAVGALVMLISRYSGSTITAVCISAAIIIVPAVLSGTGVLPVPSAADIVGYCVMI